LGRRARKQSCFEDGGAKNHSATHCHHHGWQRSLGPTAWFAADQGHEKGADAVREWVGGCGELKVEYLTLYAFSVENWNRPKDEVDALMKYLVHYLKSETPELNKNNVRLEIIGQTYRLPEAVQEHLKKSLATLSKNNGLTLIMALSYGGRTEIVDAVRSIAEKAKSGDLDPGTSPSRGSRTVISRHATAMSVVLSQAACLTQHR